MKRYRTRATLFVWLSAFALLAVSVPAVAAPPGTYTYEWTDVNANFGVGNVNIHIDGHADSWPATDFDLGIGVSVDGGAYECWINTVNNDIYGLYINDNGEYLDVNFEGWSECGDYLIVQIRVTYDTHLERVHINRTGEQVKEEVQADYEADFGVTVWADDWDGVDPNELNPELIIDGGWFDNGTYRAGTGYAHSTGTPGNPHK